MRMHRTFSGVISVACLLWLCVVPAGVVLGQAEIEDEGDFILVMDAAKSEENRAMRDYLRKFGRFEELVDLLNQLALPSDITIVFREGGPEDAYYDPQEQMIVLSYEFADLIYAVFSQSPYEGYYADEEDVSEAMLHTLEYVLFHEAGHALIDVLAIPVTGREEDAVDALSAFMLSFILEEPEILVSAADFYDLMALLDEEITNEELWGEHALDEQRYYNLVCWCYGSNPDEFEYLLEESGLGEDRAERCEDEYAQIVQSWSILLAPYINE